MKEYTFERIFLETHVPPSVFLQRSKSWNKVKARLDEVFLSKIQRKVISEDSTRVMKKGLHVIELFFDRQIKRGTEIETKDAKLTSDILANFHRIKQLEEGKPTDISMYEKMTPQEALAYVSEVNRQISAKHEMSMFSTVADVPEEELLAEYTKNGAGSDVH